MLLQHNILILDLDFIKLKGGTNYLDHDHVPVWQPSVYINGTNVGTFYTEWSSGAYEIVFKDLKTRTACLENKNLITQLEKELDKLLNAMKEKPQLQEVLKYDFSTYNIERYVEAREAGTLTEHTTEALLTEFVNILYNITNARYAAIRKTIPKGKAFATFTGSMLSEMHAVEWTTGNLDEVYKVIVMDSDLGRDTTINLRHAQLVKLFGQEVDSYQTLVETQDANKIFISFK